MKGVPASPGLGAGAVFILREREVPIAGCLSIEPESELDRLVKGIGIAAAYYKNLPIVSDLRSERRMRRYSRAILSS